MNPCSAGVPPAVSGASRPRFGEVTIRERGRLPHWEKNGATYFITFRLADSLPSPVLNQILSERSSLLQNAEHFGRALTSSEHKHLERLSTSHIEKYLDSGHGACILARPPIAELVGNAIRFFENKRYRLFAWCVMPNHVHVVVRVFPSHTLEGVVHSWKSFTAKKVNTALNTKGSIWQREYYDHLIRNESEFERALNYVGENPAKAGLHGWKWVWVCGRDAPTTAGGTPALHEAVADNE